jgi:hypothetical protein
MRKKHFYSFLVETTQITLDIGDLDLDQQDRIYLLSLVEANIHSSVIKEILDNLEPEDKKIFLKNLSSSDNKTIWKHLNSKIYNAEDRIKRVINNTINELKEDIKKSKS